MIIKDMVMLWPVVVLVERIMNHKVTVHIGLLAMLMSCKVMVLMLTKMTVLSVSVMNCNKPILVMYKSFQPDGIER